MIVGITLACLVMALVETVVQPGYLVKSCIKLLLFSVLVFGLGFRTPFRREGLWLGLMLGGGIFAVILGAFFCFRSFIDLGAIADTLLGKEGISRENFAWSQSMTTVLALRMTSFFTIMSPSVPQVKPASALQPETPMSARSILIFSNISRVF